MSPGKRLIGITTGDPDGIGTEVTAKALEKLGPRRDACFTLWRSANTPEAFLRRIDRQFERITVHSWEDAQELLPSLKATQLIDLVSCESPGHWVVAAAKACLSGVLHGIATAPLSKTTIKRGGLNFIGHTDILQSITGSREVFMAFIGPSFNVLLATAHIPLMQVSQHLTSSKLLRALDAANRMRQMLDTRKRSRPVALVGLNPHAGEQGLIGSEEIEVFSTALQEAKKKNINVLGPLVPDAAFFQDSWKKYSVYVTPYHDQGLIPFKMIHGQNSGVHVTMGLPFIRTSVDHGTAKDLFGKNKANANSMYEALLWSIKLTKAAVDTKF